MVDMISDGEPLPFWVADTFEAALPGEIEDLPDEVIEPIAADLVATLGYTPEDARRVVRSVGSGQYGDHGTKNLAEVVQQWLHDTFLDTTWPQCPDHRRHPLWLDDAQPPMWTCDETERPMCPLGQLGSIFTVDQATAALNRRRLAHEEAETAAHAAMFERHLDQRGK
jgi:hypothetical protein